MNRQHTPRPGAQRGAAALIVVLLLFFIISLVAAYAGRNLIFEQKTSANQYRATQAFETAEAGLEWALAMLNGGRVDSECKPSTNATDGTFRQRFLRDPDPDPNGRYEPSTYVNAGATERLRPSCVRRTDDPLNPNQNPWSCSCRTDGPPVLAAPGGNGVFPAFRVCFEPVPADPLVPLGAVQPGAVRIVSTGGTRFAEGVVDQPCTQRGEGIDGEAAATVSVVVALTSALPTPPSVALTVRGNFDVTGAMRLLPSPVPGRLALDSTYMPNGWLAQVGDPTPSLPLAEPRDVLGTPLTALVATDLALGSATTTEMFASLFNMDNGTYKKQPATVVLDDCATACSIKLVNAVKANPGRILWVEGDMTVESDVNLGCPVNPGDPVLNPVLIVANGNVNLVAASVSICGLLYSLAPDWNNAGGVDVNLRGAAVAQGNFIGGGTPTIVYDPPALNRLKLGTGSFVRVPGSWRDFP